MTDSFGSFLKSSSQRDRNELDNPLSPSRLILAAVQAGAKADRDLMYDIGLGDVEFRSALQLLADAKLVRVWPQAGMLMIATTEEGTKRAG